jgi:hypothetical protein
MNIKGTTREIWSYVFRLFGVEWVISGCVMEVVAGWRNWFGKHYSEVWNLVPHCVIWSIWRERNSHTFEDLEHSVDQIIEFCMCSLLLFLIRLRLGASQPLLRWGVSLIPYNILLFCNSFSYGAFMLYAHQYFFNKTVYYLSKKGTR